LYLCPLLYVHELCAEMPIYSVSSIARELRFIALCMYVQPMLIAIQNLASLSTITKPMYQLLEVVSTLIHWVSTIVTYAQWRI